jgi:hypothetical protein
MITEGDRLNRNPEGGTKKIRILLPEDAWHKVEAEWLWGELIEDSIYALRNTPFYALGLSYDDRVKVDDVDGNLTMLGVVSRGGHSTYRIFAKKGDENSRVQALFRKLHDLHCGIEGATEKLIAVDVLPEADIHKVYQVLERAEQDGIIDFEEGHCGHPLASKPQ